MKAKFSVFLPVLMVCCAVLAVSGGAAEKHTTIGKRTPAFSAKKIVKPNNLGAIAGAKNAGVMQLSISECVDLGGTIFLTSVCKTGHACERHDEDNNAHMVCIHEIE